MNRYHLMDYLKYEGNRFPIGSPHGYCLTAGTSRGTDFSWWTFPT